MSGSFPQRLVDVMSRDTLGAIVFNRDRNGLIINLPLFDRLYLLTGHFRTRRLPSFIRQLNLYGFKQVNHADKKSQVKEYRHVFLTFSNHLELEWLTRISAAKGTANTLISREFNPGL